MLIVFRQDTAEDYYRYHVVLQNETTKNGSFNVPFNISVDMMVAVQVLQASCCPFSDQASLSPGQRRTFFLKGQKHTVEISV